MLYHFLQRSQCDVDLANCVRFEVKSYLKDVITNKISSEKLINTLTKLFPKFRNLEELNLGEDKRYKMIRYFDELRDTRIEVFKKVESDLRMHIPKAFDITKEDSRKPPKFPSVIGNKSFTPPTVVQHCHSLPEGEITSIKLAQNSRSEPISQVGTKRMLSQVHHDEPQGE